MRAQALNLLVFRDGARQVGGSALKTALAHSLQSLPDSFQVNAILATLLRAGELECALSDCGAAAGPLEKIADSVATAMVTSTPVSDRNHLLEILGNTLVPETLTLSVPEGFAYYALHPLSFAEVLGKTSPANRALVIGIRSIGTTLSAVTSAALRTHGIQAQRITVRPTGHPYNRYADLTSEQLALIGKETSLGAGILIVDEGPGLSGSSFLSVAEALMHAEVPRDRITLVCSHLPEVDQLRAEHAAQRWPQFRCVEVSSQPRRPAGAGFWIGGGEWRGCMLPQASSWPASWLTFERLKYLSGPGAEPRFYKFLGFGHYGNEVFEREERVSTAGFGASPQMEDAGFASYRFIEGRPMSAADLSESVVARLAAYCAFRLETFACESADSSALQQMAEHDFQELRLDLPPKLSLEKPVIADGRMQPHEWVLTPQGQILKTDSGSHGEDHFFPGATDIAWDLAGAIVEWQMDAVHAQAFLEMYRRATGDDVRMRIEDYIKAYSVFRWAYCLMAANAMPDTEEQSRLERAASRYGAVLMRFGSVRA